MSAGKSTQRLPFMPEGMSDDSASVGLELNGDGTVTLTLRIDHGVAREVIDRWTWNPARITIESGDKRISSSFPVIKESPKRN